MYVVYLQEISLADIENQISKTALEASDIHAILKHLQSTLDDISQTMQKQNNLITKSEGEISRNNALIGRKQTQIDQLNRKIKDKMSQNGGGVSNTCTSAYMYSIL